MNKTWASGAIELLAHASGHIGLDTAFDKRIAFISIDNAVEITIRTYKGMPVTTANPIRLLVLTNDIKISAERDCDPLHDYRNQFVPFL